MKFRTPFFSINIEKIPSLMENPQVGEITIDLDAIKEELNRQFFAAIENNRVSIVRAMIDCGAVSQDEMPIKYGVTQNIRSGAYGEAIRVGNVEIAEILKIAGFDPQCEHGLQEIIDAAMESGSRIYKEKVISIVSLING